MSPRAHSRRAAKPRLRELGISIGRLVPGPMNAITDVAGVQVGHATIIRDAGASTSGRGPVRTGVTAIWPNAGDVFDDRLVGGHFVLNGAGEMSGLIQVQEWGIIETPILLTNTLSVGTVSEATVQYMLDRHPGIGLEQDVIIPLVGECDDSHLNDIRGRHVKARHVREALVSANGGPVLEGNVGGGTGMVTCDVKGGIGTASRRLPDQDGGYTVGVLVMSNFGRLEDLRLDGIPVGEVLLPILSGLARRRSLYGSIIAVLGTDAPLTSHQLNRLCKRVALGIGRVGSYAAHGSGEIILAFSTANTIPRVRERSLIQLTILADVGLDPLYRAVVECTEEAIWNALCAAEDLSGPDGVHAMAVPMDVLLDTWCGAGRR